MDKLCFACQLPITPKLKSPKVWVHRYSGDWLTWRCNACSKIGGFDGWWNFEGDPRCPGCRGPLETDHVADPDDFIHAAGRAVETLVEAFINAGTTVGPGTWPLCDILPQPFKSGS